MAATEIDLGWLPDDDREFIGMIERQLRAAGNECGLHLLAAAVCLLRDNPEEQDACQVPYSLVASLALAQSDGHFHALCHGLAPIVRQYHATWLALHATMLDAVKAREN